MFRPIANSLTMLIYTKNVLFSSHDERFPFVGLTGRETPGELYQEGHLDVAGAIDALDDVR